MKKLLKNQDFLASTQLNPKASVWTKWHQERVVNDEMSRDFGGFKNQRYLMIVKEIVEPRFQAKLLDWVTRINEQHKKGLHVIKTVVDLKGTKRFKKTSDQPQALTTDNLNLDVSQASNAKDILRKLCTTTAYAQNFGERPQAEQDFGILKNKQFSRLPIA